VAELRALLCGAPDDTWLLPFLTAAARSAATGQGGGGGAAAGHVAVVVASRAAVGDGAYLYLLCTLASGCCAAAAAAAAQGGSGGQAVAAATADAEALVAAELRRRSDDGTAATVDLALLVGPHAAGLERTSAAWLQRSLGQRADASQAEAHLATLAARVLSRDPPAGGAGQGFLGSLPLRVQVAPLVVAAVAAHLAPADQLAWLARVLRHGQQGHRSLLPASLPASLTRSAAVVDVLLADPSPEAQLQGLSALCARGGPAASDRVRQVADAATSLLVAQHARGLLAGLTAAASNGTSSGSSSGSGGATKASVAFPSASSSSGGWVQLSDGTYRKCTSLTESGDVSDLFGID
jgi:hypothetical protein